MIENSTKYPRTFHFPFSPGLSGDDKIANVDWDWFISHNLVLTEKLDGENSALKFDGVFARSHSSEAHHPWNKNLWQEGGLFDRIKPYLDEDTIYYGENLYGVHSIEYNNLNKYFHLFAIRHKDKFLRWTEVEDFATILEIPTVPVLGRGKFRDMRQLEKEIIECHMKWGSAYGNEIEGVVVRIVDEFDVKDFNTHVVKYVRENHVQTDSHWKKNWKKAKLNYEKWQHL